MFAAFGSGKIIIYKLNAIYSETQTIQESFSVRSVCMNEQKTVIAATGFDALLRIYEKSGADFVNVQTINTGITALEVKLTNSEVVVSGYSN